MVVGNHLVFGLPARSLFPALKLYGRQIHLRFRTFSKWAAPAEAGIWLLEFNLMDVIISTEAVDLQESDLLITALFQDERPLRGSIGWIDWRLNGMLSRFLIENKLTGEWRERTLIPSQGRIYPRLILIFGLGKVKEYSYLSVREVVPFMAETLKNLKTSHICLSLPYGEEYNVDCGKLAEVFLEGLTDSLDQYPSDRELMKNLTLSLGESEERFSEVLLGVQTAKSILKDRLPIRILTPSEIPLKTRQSF